MAHNNSCDKFDINVQNMSKQYGNPRETFEILKATINNTFENLGLLDEYTSVHEALLNRLQNTNIKFGGIPFEF